MSQLSFLFIASLCILSVNAKSQDVGSNLSKKSYTPVKISESEAPKIDGSLNDVCWALAPDATGFVQYSPDFGKAGTFVSRVKVVYDNEAIYVGVLLLDREPAKINASLTKRDERASGVADHFIVGFDTYLDGNNGFRFEVTAANAQTDARLASPNTYDIKWDAVWESGVKMTTEGWTVEYKIPFAALRFPKKDVQSWGLQFSRYIQRLGELNTWSPTDPRIENIVQQWGILKDLKNIKPPLRLSFSPFAVAYAERIPISNNPTKYKTQNAANGGMDVKWGLNESFTLDMTLIPDFGQVQSDNTVFNLSPFEVQYEERRPFFTEGSELFNKNSIFYSRRIGGRPAGYNLVQSQLLQNEEIVKNPNVTRLINATKFSGRTPGGLGIGILNAIAAPTYATIRNTISGETRKVQTGVLANQNVLVLDKNLKNNSSLTFTNASMVRNGAARDANVAEAALRLNNKALSHKFTAVYKLSHVVTPSARQKQKTGNGYQLQFEKIRGTYQYAIGSSMLDGKWDPSDMGIFSGNNTLNNFASLTINNVEKRKHFQRQVLTNSIAWKLRVKPMNYAQIRFNSRAVLIRNNFSSYNISLMTMPFWQNDFFEPRVEGMKLKMPPLAFINATYNSDPRKELSFSLTGIFGETILPNDPYLSSEASLTWRATKKLTFDISSSVIKDRNNFGFVRYDNTADKVVIGKRNINTVENTLSIAYTISPKMNINFRTRHYWTKITYNEFIYLKSDGFWDNKAFEPGNDFNFNAFNIDCVYAWQIAPGSFLNIIWKNGITEDDNMIQDGYGKNFSKTLNAPQANSFITKLIYYLRYKAKRKSL